MAEVRDLEVGDYFVFTKRPYYLYLVIQSDEKVIMVKEMATQVPARGWRINVQEPTVCNPYELCKKVKLEIV